MTIRKSIIAGLIGLGFSAGVFAAPTVNTGGQVVTNEGLTTSQGGVTVLNFNTNVIPANILFTPGANHLQTGSSAGQYAAPPNDLSRYLCVGTFCGSPVTIGFDLVNFPASEANYIGFYAGSLDAFNSIEFRDHGVLRLTLTGTEMATLAGIPPNGDQTKGEYFNVFPDPQFKFTSVTLFSSSNAFEVDNFAIGIATPEQKIPLPGTLALLGLGFLGVGSLKKREKAC